MEPITSVSRLLEYVDAQLDDGLQLFRGQPEDLPLLPKIARGTLTQDFLSEEQRLLKEFKIRSNPYLDPVKRDDWDWLAIAQHHRMATRLLDWSANPLAGLWFAVRENPGSGQFGVLWIFPVSNDDIVAKQETEKPFGGERTMVFRPKHLTKTIVAQSGWFTVHKYMKERREFIPFEQNKLYKRECQKLRISASDFPKLRQQLDRVGINDSTMFPDLRGLCDYLNFVHLPKLVVQRFPRGRLSGRPE